MTMPLPPDPSTGLSTSSVEAVQDLLAVSGILHPLGVDVQQDRFLAQVVPDDVRNVGVDQLVVGDAVADRVGDASRCRRGRR